MFESVLGGNSDRLIFTIEMLGLKLKFKSQFIKKTNYENINT